MKSARDIGTVAGLVVGIAGVIATFSGVSPDQAGENLHLYMQQFVRVLPWLVAALACVFAVVVFLEAKATAAKTNQKLLNVDDVSATFLNRTDQRYKTRLFTAFNKANEIRIVGISNDQLADNPDAIKRIIGQGGRLRVVYLDPNSPATVERERQEKHEPDAIKGRTNYNIEILRQLLRKSGFSKDLIDRRVEARTIDAFSAINLIICDTQCAFVHYYGFDTPGVSAPAFILEGSTGEWLSFFDHQFEAVWNAAKPLKLVS